MGMVQPQRRPEARAEELLPAQVDPDHRVLQLEDLRNQSLRSGETRPKTGEQKVPSHRPQRQHDSPTPVAVEQPADLYH